MEIAAESCQLTANGFPSNALAVWYVHIQAGGVLETYFELHHTFKPYVYDANNRLLRVISSEERTEMGENKYANVMHQTVDPRKSS